MQPTCIAIDFDGTLAYFTGGYEQLFDIFVRRGVPQEIVRRGYEKTKQEGGFSIVAMIDVMSVLVGHLFDREAIEGEFSVWLRQSLFLYPDSLPWLTEWRRRGVPIAIVTAGNADYQTQKISTLAVPHDHLFVVVKEDEKPTVVRKLLKRYGAPILLVEDRPSVLDLMRNGNLMEGEVVNVRLLRKESPYYHDEPTHHCHCFVTLAECQCWLETTLETITH